MMITIAKAKKILKNLECDKEYWVREVALNPQLLFGELGAEYFEGTEHDYKVIMSQLEEK